MVRCVPAIISRIPANPQYDAGIQVWGDKEKALRDEIRSLALQIDARGRTEMSLRHELEAVKQEVAKLQVTNEGLVVAARKDEAMVLELRNHLTLVTNQLAQEQERRSWLIGSQRHENGP